MIAGAIAAVGAAGILSGAGEASALPNGSKVTRGLDGESAKITRKGESARVIGTVANNPASRGALLSGTYTADLGGGINGTETLYLIAGCQVDVSGVTLDFSAAISLNALNASTGLSLPLKPGEVAIAKITDKSIKTDGKASIQLSGYSVAINQCGGYASARTAAVVEGAKGYAINNDDDVVTGTGTFLKTTLYGRPFSLG
ncbi:MspA family porin [Gordonia sp. FQ]|uniref:MspA family porin n=1 Tax=Gordonia sp. FQ TaxID=3446634 RepID=UPI003F825D7A